MIKNCRKVSFATDFYRQSNQVAKKKNTTRFYSRINHLTLIWKKVSMIYGHATKQTKALKMDIKSLVHAAMKVKRNMETFFTDHGILLRVHRVTAEDVQTLLNVYHWVMAR